MIASQLPISLHGGAKGQARTQFAALCYRMRRGKVQILLVTSRKRGRWIVPKGWPMHGLTPAESAAQEAWEEAGVRGAPSQLCLGVYSYAKDREDCGPLSCLAMLFPVKVVSLAKVYPESDARRRRWVSLKKASRMVLEPELSRIIRDFDPRARVRLT